MQIHVNTDGYIDGYATVGGFPDGIEVDDLVVEELDVDKLALGCYQYINGQAILDQTKCESIQYEAEAEALRAQRETECFAVCDRYMWYNFLSSTNKAKVKEWYKAWLDVTETRTVPEPPECVKNSDGEEVM